MRRFIEQRRKRCNQVLFIVCAVEFSCDAVYLANSDLADALSDGVRILTKVVAYVCYTRLKKTIQQPFDSGEVLIPHCDRSTLEYCAILRFVVLFVYACHFRRILVCRL